MVECVCVCVCGYNSRQSATAAAVGNSEIPLHGKQGTESKRERAESFLYFPIHKGAAWGKLACQWPQPGHTIERLRHSNRPHIENTIGEEIYLTENAEKRKMHQRASLSIWNGDEALLYVTWHTHTVLSPSRILSDRRLMSAFFFHFHKRATIYQTTV